VKIIEFEEVYSTNDMARYLAQEGEDAPFWVISKKQTNGRGRRGRVWSSLSGNLFATYVIKLDDVSKLSPLYSFIIAIALKNCIEKYIPNKQTLLKWPNDILVEGKKISGILLESWIDKPNAFIAIGVGVNLLQSPDIEDKETTSIKDYSKPPEPKYLLSQLDAEFNILHEIYINEGFDPIKKMWEENAFGFGKPVTIKSHNENFFGIFNGINEAGELILIDEAQNIKFIQAGDVNFTH